MSQRRVLVTGSSRGIGAAIARRLAARGWDVALHYGTSRDAAEELATELGERSAGVYGADLADPTQAERLWRQAERDGPISALVNNAGVYLPMRLAEATDAVFEANYARSWAVNFESPMRLCRLAARSFAEGGRILNVCSRVGFRGEAGASLYAAPKAALVNLTRSLAAELAGRGVGVFGLAPGWVDTAMARPGMAERLPDILRDIPLGRVATPDDCAAAAAFLLSDEAAYLSGVVIDINGASYFH